MPRTYTFTIKHYPINGLLEIDLENDMNQMAEVGWEFVSTQQLINEYSDTTPQMTLFWVKGD